MQLFHSLGLKPIVTLLGALTDIVTVLTFESYKFAVDRASAPEYRNSALDLDLWFQNYRQICTDFSLGASLIIHALWTLITNFIVTICLVLLSHISVTVCFWQIIFLCCMIDSVELTTFVFLQNTVLEFIVWTIFRVIAQFGCFPLTLRTTTSNFNAPPEVSGLAI